MPTHTPSVVVTGMGAVGPGFWSVRALRGAIYGNKAYFRTTSSLFGNSGRAELLPRYVGLLDRTRLAEWRGRHRNVLSDYTALACLVANQAIRNARVRLPNHPWSKVGVYWGTAAGPLREYERAFGRRVYTPKAVIRCTPHTAAAEVAITLSLRGDVKSCASGCCAGLQAVGDAFAAIRSGRIDAAVVGAVDFPVSAPMLLAYARMGFLSRSPSSARKAQMPFQTPGTGFVLSEGAFALLLERRDTATAREAPILAEVTGYGNYCDAFHQVYMSQDGAGIEIALRDALKYVPRRRPVVVFAHTTSFRDDDGIELDAIDRATEGRAQSVITSVKGKIGHSFSAAAGHHLVAAIIALRSTRGVPGINPRGAARLCGRSRIAWLNTPTTARHAVVNARSFGSTYTSVSIVAVPAGYRR